MEIKSDKWEGKTGGGRFGQFFLLWVLQRVSVRVLYPIIYLVIPFYLLFAHKGYHAIYSYFRDRYSYTWWKSFYYTYLNHLTFGKVVLDKFALLAGNESQFKITIEGSEEVTSIFESEQGFIMAGAHVGNPEIGGMGIKDKKKIINGIIFGGESANFQSQRDKAFGRAKINLIPVTTDMSHIFAIKNAIENGEIVMVACDRMMGSQKGYSIPFLGEEANFPAGMFRIAAQLRSKMMAYFVMKEKGLNYRVFVRELSCLSGEESSAKIAEAFARNYVKELEKIVKQYPEQWFNFYPFWEK